MIFPLWDSGGQICTGILFRAIDSLSYPASTPPSLGRLILLHNPCAWYIDTFLFAHRDLIFRFSLKIKVNFPFFNWLYHRIRFSWGLLPKAITGIEPCQSQSRDRCFTCVVLGMLRTLELFTKVEGFLM